MNGETTVTRSVACCAGPLWFIRSNGSRRGSPLTAHPVLATEFASSGKRCECNFARTLQARVSYAIHDGVRGNRIRKDILSGCGRCLGQSGQPKEDPEQKPEVGIQ